VRLSRRRNRKKARDTIRRGSQRIPRSFLEAVRVHGSGKTIRGAATSSGDQRGKEFPVVGVLIRGPDETKKGRKKTDKKKKFEKRAPG